MCDTLWMQREDAIFAKNSDRQVNEPNIVVNIPSKNYKAGETVKCTYIEIPQVERTMGVLLYKPSWIWGAEMGINEARVCIGNEAVFTKSKGKKIQSLIGMDFLRLALERGATAKDAVDIIINLLTKYGQGGNCGFEKPFYYDNSYLISDPNECYVVETSGREFIVKKQERQANISNRISDAAFAKKNAEPLFTFFSGSKKRKGFIEENLKKLETANIGDIFNLLRGHAHDKKLFNRGSLKSVCQHSGMIDSHTTGSMAVRYRKNLPSTIWITGSSTPCLSIFKPCFLGINVAPVFDNENDSFKYWMEREYFNRAVFAGIIDADSFRTKARSLEAEFIKGEQQLFNSGKVDKKVLEQFAKSCSEKESKLYAEYAEQIAKVKNGQVKFSKSWTKKNKSLGKR